MPHRHFRILLYCSIALFTIQSCKEPVSSGAPGDIIGTVQVYDTNYVAMTDNSGVKVSLEGTPYSALSDASGKWHLTNIPAGTYTLVFSKDGYGIAKQQNLEFTGNGTLLYDILTIYNRIHAMYPIPNLYPNLVIRPFDDLIQVNQRDTFYKDSTGNTRGKYIYDTVITKLEIAIFSCRTQYIYHGQAPYNIVFLGKVQNIDPSIPTSYEYSYGFYDNQDTSGIANVQLRRSELLRSGFSSGDNIYCVVYSGTIPYSIQTWTDPTTGKTIYSGFSPYHSEVKSFILP